MISVTFFEMPFLSFLSNILEKTSFVFGELFFTSFTIFFAEFKELMPLEISFVPAWIMMQSGLSATKFSISSNTFSEVPPGKFLTVTWWSLDSPFSLIPLRRESPVTTTFFFLFNLIVCSSSLGISDSILSLRGLLFALLLSWLWFCREFEEICERIVYW